MSLSIKDSDGVWKNSKALSVKVDTDSWLNAQAGWIKVDSTGNEFVDWKPFTEAITPRISIVECEGVIPTDNIAKVGDTLYGYRGSNLLTEYDWDWRRSSNSDMSSSTSLDSGTEYTVGDTCQNRGPIGPTNEVDKKYYQIWINEVGDTDTPYKSNIVQIVRYAPVFMTHPSVSPSYTSFGSNPFIVKSDGTIITSATAGVTDVVCKLAFKVTTSSIDYDTVPETGTVTWYDNNNNILFGGADSLTINQSPASAPGTLTSPSHTVPIGITSIYAEVELVNSGGTTTKTTYNTITVTSAPSITTNPLAATVTYPTAETGTTGTYTGVSGGITSTLIYAATSAAVGGAYANQLNTASHDSGTSIGGLSTNNASLVGYYFAVRDIFTGNNGQTYYVYSTPVIYGFGTQTTPTLGTPTPTSNGFTVQITAGYDSDASYMYYFGTGTPSASVDSSGLITVTGMSGGTSTTFYIRKIKLGYSPIDSNTVTGSSLGAALNPTFGTNTATVGGFTGSVTNYDSNFTWNTPSVVGGTLTAGTFTWGSPSGSIRPFTVSGLTSLQSSTVTVTTSRSGYSSGTGSTTGTSSLDTPNAPTFSSITSSSAVVSWTAVTNAVSYNLLVYQGGSIYGTYNNISTNSYTISVPMNVAYTIYVKAWSGANNTGSSSAYSSGATMGPYYTVTFDGNGQTYGSPSISNVTQQSIGGSVTLATQGTLGKPGYTFAGWNTNSSGTGTNYAAGSSYTPIANITLYAKWVSSATVPSAPINLRINSITTTSLGFTWDSIPNGGSALTDIQTSLNGTSWTSLGASATGGSWSGLSVYTSYTIYVRGVNAIGNGSSSSVNGTTNGIAPVISSVSVTPSTYTTASVGSNLTANISISNYGTPAVSPTYSWSSAGGHSGTGTTYTIQSDDVGSRPTVTTSGAVSRSGNTVSITQTAVFSNGNAASWFWSASPSGASQNNGNSFTASPGDTVSIIWFSPANVYSTSVTATMSNAFGTSSRTGSSTISRTWTDSTSISIPSATAPSIPTNLVNTYTGLASWTGSWTASATGSTPITYYWTLYQSATYGGSITATASGSTTGTSFSQTMTYANGTWAYFTVYANNSAGSSSTATSGWA